MAHGATGVHKKAAEDKGSKDPDLRQSEGAPSKSPPKVGSRAPEFSLRADDGSEVRLADLRGQRVVLYFYPKDMTPGCTQEACAFRDAHSEFQRVDTVVLGVSRDTTLKHQRFREKENLPFRLLSDPEADVIRRYGSWGPKKFMGRSFDGILRTTVVIGPDGTVERHYPKVSPKEHARQVLADIEGTQNVQ